MSAAIVVSTHGEDLVAVKAGPDSGALEREATRLSLIDHPGIVELIGFEAGPPARLLTRFVGPDDWNDHSVSDPDDAVTSLARIAGIVADLHEVGITHGSIHPDHVLVAADGRPVLCSLGRATEADGIALATDHGDLAELLTATDAGRHNPAVEQIAEGLRSGRTNARTATVQLNAVGARPPSSSGRLVASLTVSFFRRVAGRRLAGQSGRSGPREPREPREPKGPNGPRGPRAEFADQIDEPDSPRMAGPARPGRQVRISGAAATAGAAAAILVVGALGAVALGGWSGGVAGGDPGGGLVGNQGDPSQIGTNEIPVATAAAPGSSSSSFPGSGSSSSSSPGSRSSTLVASGLEIEHGGRLYAIGEPGDVVVVGDWSCRGADTPAVLRPRTGTIALFLTWPAPGESALPQYVETIEGAMELSIDETGACPHVRVHTPDASHLVLADLEEVADLADLADLAEPTDAPGAT